MKFPGSEPIHLDLEKLCLLSVSKESLDSRREGKKLNSNCFVCVFLFCRSPFLLYSRNAAIRSDHKVAQGLEITENRKKLRSSGSKTKENQRKTKKDQRKSMKTYDRQGPSAGPV